MIKLIIFGGTQEGRELAEWAQKNGFCVVLSVATDYGEAVCAPGENLLIRKGRMDSDEMADLFEKESPLLVVDATHPYAVSVSENIKSAADKKHLPLIRLTRPASVISLGDEYGDWKTGSVFYVSSAEEAMEYLKRDDAPVLLTTGSKELSEFVSLPDFAARVYARVLPVTAAISACEKAGLSGRHIIAMQGPFSEEMNTALINSVGAKWLVTKESGENGGFQEKIRAAAICHIRVIVISRPLNEEGLNLAETKRELLKTKELSDESRCAPPSITLLGAGMGGGSQLTVEALRALGEASVIFGAKRLIEDIRAYVPQTPVVPFYKAEDILAYLNEHQEMKKACVVFSGDTGFYSGCAGFLSTLRQPLDSLIRKNEGPDTGKTPKSGISYPSVRILPGISAFSALCARFGLREEEFTPASAHGKETDVVKLLSKHNKVFLLLDPGNTIGKICRTLTEAGLGDTKVYAGIRLGYTDEELLCGMAYDFTGRGKDALAAMAMEREDNS